MGREKREHGLRRERSGDSKKKDACDEEEPTTEKETTVASGLIDRARI